MGILDYLLFWSKPTQSLLQFIFTYVSFDKDSKVIIWALPLLIMFSLMLPKIVLAFSLLCAFSPLIILTHFMMQPIKYLLNRKADRMVLKDSLVKTDEEKRYWSELTHVIKSTTPTSILKELKAQEGDKLKMHLLADVRGVPQCFIALQSVLMHASFSGLTVYDREQPRSGIIGITAIDEENIDAISSAFRVNRLDITNSTDDTALDRLEQEMKTVKGYRFFRSNLSAVNKRVTRFPGPLLNIIFCYAGVANKKQNSDYEASSSVKIKVLEDKSTPVDAKPRAQAKVSS